MPAFMRDGKALAIDVMERVNAYDSIAFAADKHTSQFTVKRRVPNMRPKPVRNILYRYRRF